MVPTFASHYHLKTYVLIGFIRLGKKQCFHMRLSLHPSAVGQLCDESIDCDFMLIDLLLFSIQLLSNQFAN